MSGAFYGWRVVTAVFVIAVFGWGLGFYGPPVYLHAVTHARGWPVALVSAAITTHFLFGAVIVACLPALYARFGLVRVTKIGSVALGVGVVGWALAAEPWQLFAATLVSGTGWACMGAAAVNAIVSPWFVRARPAALAAAYNGASIGGVIFSPLWVAAIAHAGFSVAAASIGLAMVIAIWWLTDIYVARTPQNMGLLPDGDAGDAPAAAPATKRPEPSPARSLWCDLRFVTLAGGMALGLFAQIGLLAHLFSLLVPALGAQLAGLAAGAATAAAILGRTLFGWMMPVNGDRRRYACASYAVQIAGTVAFLLAAGQSVSLLLAGVVLFGFGIGNATSLPPTIAHAEFTKEDAARAVPLIVAIAQAAYAFAPAAFGLVRDSSPAGQGSATALFLCAGGIQAAAIFCLLAGSRRN